MGRALRVATGGLVYPALNRANARLPILDNEEDYRAFERVLVQMQARVAMRILAYCLMPNHWHLVLWPRHDGDLSQFMRLVTLTHTQRWHAHHHILRALPRRNPMGEGLKTGDRKIEKHLPRVGAAVCHRHSTNHDSPLANHGSRS
jgi:REP element-mobilizing transposase RayT